MKKTFQKVVVSIYMVAYLGFTLTPVFAALGTGAIGYYKLQSDGTDSVGTIGTMTGTNPSFVTGIIGNGAKFVSASSQYLASSAYTGSGSYTANVWYNPQTRLSTQVIINKDDVLTGRVFSLLDGGDTITLFAWGTSQAFHQTTPAVGGMSNNTWYMWSIVWDAANNIVTVYKNCVSFATITLTGNQAADTVSTPLTIGRQGNATNYNDATIDEIYVSTSAKTATEICSLYNGGSPGAAQQYPFSSVPLYWNWDY